MGFAHARFGALQDAKHPDGFPAVGQRCRTGGDAIEEVPALFDQGLFLGMATSRASMFAAWGTPWSQETSCAYTRNYPASTQRR